MKYAVVGIPTEEAIREWGLLEGYRSRSAWVNLDNARLARDRWDSKPLLVMDGPDETREIGKMYAEVWIEDENGKRVTSPGKRVG